MSFRRSFAFAFHGLLIGLAPTAVALHSSAAPAAGNTQSVRVLLSDSDAEHMILQVDTRKVSPGSVTFEVMNLSKDQIHELIIIKSDGAGRPLPYDAGNERVVEDKVNDLGEVADLDPGKSGKLTLDLTPGTYILICNQPGHYMHGMKANLVVAD